MIVVNEVTSNYEILLQLIYYFSSFRFVNGFKSLKSDNLIKFIFICSYLLMAVRRLKLTKADKVFFISCMRYGTAIIIEGSVSCSDLGGYTLESVNMSLDPAK